jgi:peptidoglycan/xylan/chitin deacetylase (PgdA/CDA1 family)
LQREPRMTLARFVISITAALILSPMTRAATPPRVAILGYHEVDAAPTEGWSVRTDDFEAQLNLLARTGWTVIPLRDLYDYTTGTRSSLPDRSVVITVDDGWLCTKTEMQPRFRQHGFPFTVFVYPKILGQGEHVLTWDDVKSMSAAGVDVQSHTMSHAHLNRASQSARSDEEYASWLQNELAGSKELLEKALGKPVIFLAYPYGEYEAVVEAALAKSGYLAGITSQTTKPEFNVRGTNPYHMARFVVDSSTTIERFRRSLGGADLILENLSPPLDAVIAPGQKTISATIKEAARYAPGSLHIALLTDDAATPHYAEASAAVSLEIAGPLTTGRQQIAVWGDDAVTGERRTAVWTFYRSPEDKADYEAAASKLGALPLHHTAVTP